MKILLVEDSKTIRRENETVLLKAGYDVICAEDGEIALRLAQEQHPDLILLDMILPKLAGPEVLQHLKSQPGTAEIPVVVVSSLPEKNRQKLSCLRCSSFTWRSERKMAATSSMNLRSSASSFLSTGARKVAAWLPLNRPVT